MELIKVNKKELLETVKKAIEKTNELLDSKVCAKEDLYTTVDTAILICSEKISIEVKRACIEFEGKERRGEIYLFYVYPEKISEFEQRKYENVFVKLHSLKKLLETANSDEVSVEYDFPFAVFKIDNEEVKF
jgi:hypothetical protein